MKKICRLLRSKKGFSSAPWAVVLTLVSLMLFVVLWQFARLFTISAGVRDAVQSAVISASVGNYANVYDGIREGYSGGYKYSGSSWKTSVSTGDIYGRLDNLLGLKTLNGKHVKLNSDDIEYIIYGLSVDIENAEFTPDLSGI